MPIEGIEYKTYKGLINQKKYAMDVGIKHMSKFYDAFKILCNIYPNVMINDNGDKFLENAILPLVVYQQICHPF